MKLTITVTEQDMVYGRSGDCGACPVARAVNRAYGKPIAQVGGYTIRLYDKVAVMPAELIDWISRFDSVEEWPEVGCSYDLEFKPIFGG